MFNAFSNYDRRMKWNLPETPLGKAGYERWKAVKDEFNALQPGIKAIFKK